jgi:hypothetical protein
MGSGGCVMIKKLLIAVIAMLSCVWAFWFGVFGLCFEKNGADQTLVIIKIDKNLIMGESIRRFSSNTFTSVGKLSGTVFSSVGGPELIRKCKEQPVLFGGLFIFFGVSACAIFVVVHQLRNATRF